MRHAETVTLLHVHTSLLYELQAQLRNLSATVQSMNRNTGCTNNVIKSAPLLSMRDTLPPGTRAANAVVSCMLYDVHATLLPHMKYFNTAAPLPAGNMTRLFYITKL